MELGLKEHGNTIVVTHKFNLFGLFQQYANRYFFVSIGSNFVLVDFREHLGLFLFVLCFLNTIELDFQ